MENQYKVKLILNDVKNNGLELFYYLTILEQWQLIKRKSINNLISSRKVDFCLIQEKNVQTMEGFLAHSIWGVCEEHY